MPSYLTTPNPDIFEQQLARATQSVRRNTINHRSPWAGWMPDIDPHLQPPNACSRSRGLVARPDPSSRGEVLMPDDGFDAVDLGNLPLDDSGADAAEITCLAELPRTNATGTVTGRFDRTLIAIVAGNDAAVEGTMYITVPGTGLWEIVPYVAGGVEPVGDRDRLYDFAIMSSGATNRAAAWSGGPIDQPVMVFCNGFDEVTVYPSDAVGDAGQHSYATLTNNPVNFIAKTCEAFVGRIYYGNTIENGTHYHQRIRRTALFTADPTNLTIGYGAMDLREFSGDLLRLEKLGSIMAAYFEDGTAFIRSTDVATAPDAYHVLKEHRGLLSTHSMVSIGDQEHFGIFDDGWFKLDASGRFTELGITNVNGAEIPKWRRTFYENLDMANRNRLFCSYDGEFVRIIYPRIGYDDASEVWIYDPRTDRVWIEDYLDGNYITVFGEASIAISAALNWNSIAALYDARGGDAWSTILGSWASMAAKFGLKALVHGNAGGYVLIHNPDFIQRLNTMTAALEYPTYEFHSVVSSFDEPRLLKTANEILIEYIYTNSPDAVLTVVGNPLRPDGTPHTPETYNIDLTPTNRQPGEVLTVRQDYDFTDTELGFELSGTSPVLFRSFESSYTIYPWEERV